LGTDQRLAACLTHRAQIVRQRNEVVLIDGLDMGIPVIVHRIRTSRSKDGAGDGPTESASPPTFAAKRIAASAEFITVPSARASGMIVRGDLGKYLAATTPG
jgi:hypothetical protein